MQIRIIFSLQAFRIKRKGVEFLCFWRCKCYIPDVRTWVEVPGELCVRETGVAVPGVLCVRETGVAVPGVLCRGDSRVDVPGVLCRGDS